MRSLSAMRATVTAPDCGGVTRLQGATAATEPFG